MVICFSKISDHLPLFSIIKKFHLDHKAFNNYKHDYHKFDEDLFKDDFQIQDWSNLERSDLESSQKFNDFYWRLSACVKRHGPLIKVGKKYFKLAQKHGFQSKYKK